MFSVNISNIYVEPPKLENTNVDPPPLKKAQPPHPTSVFMAPSLNGTKPQMENLLKFKRTSNEYKRHGLANTVQLN